MSRTSRRVIAACAGLALAHGASIALVPDPPASAINPVSGFIEIADTVLQDGDHDVRHVINPGSGQPLQVSPLTAGPPEDLAPRIAIGPGGDTWVVWWQDASTDRVLVRKRTYASGSWGSQREVGEPNESSRAPEITHDGSRPWVVWEFDATGGGTGVSVRAIDDEPDPFPIRTIVATTSYAGEVDASIHSESGDLWVTWIDGATEVGWSEYDDVADAWTAAGYESYAADDVDAARARIRETVLGN